MAEKSSDKAPSGPARKGSPLGLKTQVIIASISLIISILNTFFEPVEWLRGADIRHHILPTYSVQRESITGIELYNEGKDVAQNIDLEITANKGSSIKDFSITGDLSKYIAQTNCQFVVSQTITCSISRMLKDATGTIFVSLEAPDNLTLEGVWGDQPKEIRPIKHQTFHSPVLQALESFVGFLGLRTILKWIMEQCVIWLQNEKK